MSKYRITLDGKTYELEIERADGAVAAPAASAAPVKAAPVAAAPAAAPAPAVSAPAAPTSGTVNSPMPGTVLRVFANVGDAVKKGDAVLVLEAMKMENEITAPADGKLSALYVAAGDAVPGGAPLFAVGE